jgi:hypothetical protein
MRSRDVQVDGHDRATLERWIRAPTTPQRTVLRSRMVLLLGQGLSAREVARRLGVSRHTVDLWRERYLEEGCETLTRDRPGRGRRRSDDAGSRAEHHEAPIGRQRFVGGTEVFRGASDYCENEPVEIDLAMCRSPRAHGQTRLV